MEKISCTFFIGESFENMKFFIKNEYCGSQRLTHAVMSMDHDMILGRESG